MVTPIKEGKGHTRRGVSLVGVVDLSSSHPPTGSKSEFLTRSEVKIKARMMSGVSEEWKKNLVRAWKEGKWLRRRRSQWR